jgi:hypothetical protein
METLDKIPYVLIVSIIVGIILILLLNLILNFIYLKVVDRYYPLHKNSFSGKLLRLIYQFPEISEDSYTQKLNNSITELNEKFNEIDKILQIIESISKGKQESITNLGKRLKELENRESELKTNIATLQKTPVEAAKYFFSNIEQRDKKRKNRDIIMFILGVIITFVTSLIANHFSK